jgi:hypothetical protein
MWIATRQYERSQLPLNASVTVLVAEVILHCSRCLRAATAEALIERVYALRMCAIVTEQDNTIRAFADFVHGSSLLSPLLHKMCSIEQRRDHELDRIAQS